MSVADHSSGGFSQLEGKAKPLKDQVACFGGLNRLKNVDVRELWGPGSVLGPQ